MTKSKGKPADRRIKLIPPNSRKARDEGPRLLPLEEHEEEDLRVQHYLELADVALRDAQKKAAKPKRRRSAGDLG